MLEIQRLFFRLNKKIILQNINLNIDDGEIIGLIGKSGSGKSVLLQILSGTVKKFFGDIKLNGISLLSIPEKERYRRLTLLQNDLPENPEEKLERFLYLSRMPYKRMLAPFSDMDRQVVEDAIVRFQLQDYIRRPLGELPDGIMKRAMCAFHFVRDASLLLLDNPTAGADPQTTVLFQRELTRSVSSGKRMALIASADLNFIIQTADRILVLEEGTIAAQTSPGKIDADFIKRYFGIDVFLSKNVYNGRPNIHFFPES